MAKDWTCGNAAVFKTIGASNHANGDRQRADSWVPSSSDVFAEDWELVTE